jgi:hypothetical protein
MEKEIIASRIFLCLLSSLNLKPRRRLLSLKSKTDGEM